MDGCRANWDENTTKIFLDMCIAEKEKLNYNKKGLTKIGWSRTYDSKQLQNKFNSLKRQYKYQRQLKDKSGGGWNNNTRTIDCNEECRQDRIALENDEAKYFHEHGIPYEDELAILFSSMVNEDNTMLCIGGVGDKTPSRGSEENLGPLSEDNNAGSSEDNVGWSSVGHVAQRSRKEHGVDSPPHKKTKSMEYYAEHISERMLERNRYERSATSREQEMTELLQVPEEDGVSNGSELYFIATELFRSPGQRATYRSIKAAESRIAWLRWTWDNVNKKW
ncbi:L10-interacting MYB domain-containing protein-like [Panicum miliaceum]|uniref:L10-interacting MYB domain-containing protein-like n=1 Tax=Panicum miliaceum TaxID=4540 RepID=A0A3L6RGZ4_PANMI|nr:L10-interacting MYB domain-containing protein-like [Panicum miliaceum]